MSTLFPDHQRRLNELKMLAMSHPQWIRNNPGGRVLDLQQHLEGLLAELKTYAENGSDPSSELKEYLEAATEMVQSDDPGQEIAEMDMPDDPELTELVLKGDIEAVQRAIARYGEDVLFPVSATL